MRYNIAKAEYDSKVNMVRETTIFESNDYSEAELKFIECATNRFPCIFWYRGDLEPTEIARSTTYWKEYAKVID